VSKNTYPFFEEIHVQFDYFRGFSLSQKRKNQIGLHQNFLTCYPEQRVLEVSGASLNSLGAALSAMNLKKHTTKGLTSVESAFQSSRIYGNNAEIGPFPEYLFLPGKECKKIVKEKSEGLISYHYQFDNMYFHAPKHFISLFYNYLYLNALCEEENHEAAERLIAGEYTAFSDLATTSLNSQARSCAIFVALYHNGLLHEVRDYDTYHQLFRTTPDGKPTGPEAYENVQMLDSKDNVNLLSPVVPCTFRREDAVEWYAEHCGQLTNRKTDDNYLDVQSRT
jgi:hypothetical protein